MRTCHAGEVINPVLDKLRVPQKCSVIIANIVKHDINQGDARNDELIIMTMHNNDVAIYQNIRV